MKTWLPGESVEFLRRRTPAQDEDDAEGKRRNEDDAARALADELGNLPLALEQAAAYMDAAGMSCREYLVCYRDHRSELMGRTAPETHPDPVATTWALSMERLREESPAAADLLTLCAFFAPDDIPREVIAGGAEHLPEPLASTVGNTLAMGDVAAALRRYSLMTVDSDALSVHRLVQQAVRDGMSDDDRQRWCECAVRSLSNAMPPASLTNPDVWPTCARLLPHVRAVTEGETEPASAADALGHILNEAGLYLRIRAQFAEAAAMLRRAGQIWKAAVGPDHPIVAKSLNNLGSVLHDQGDLYEAIECFERALPIFENMRGPGRSHVADCVNNLGSVLQDQGNLSGAEARFERALRIAEKMRCPDASQVAVYLSNLGGVLHCQGDPDGATEHYERALRMDEDTYGRDHMKVATRLNNLGLTLLDQRDPARARECFDRAWCIDEDTYGADHPDVAIDVNNLGLALFQQGEVSAAVHSFQRALRIHVRFLGMHHPRAVETQRSLDTALAAVRR